MSNFVFGARSRGNLAGVHPNLVRALERGLSYSPYDFAVDEGARSFERQQLLVASGASRTLRSKHLVQADGFAHAVDIRVVGDLDGDGDIDSADKRLTWEFERYHAVAGAIMRAAHDLGVRVTWGGDWERLRDGPHFELG